MTALDTPVQISNWYFLSAVSQLSFELKTGHNWYGKTSVYKGIRLNMVPGLPARATKHNKIIALATLLDATEGAPGEVFDSARKTLADTLEAEGLVLNRA